MGLWRIEDINGNPVDLELAFRFYVEKSTATGYPEVNNVFNELGIDDGAIFQRTVARAREFTLIGTIVAESVFMFHARRNGLINLIRRDRTTATQPITISYYANGRSLEIDCYYQGGLTNEGDLMGFNDKLALRFVAPDPFWQELPAISTSLIVNSATAVTNFGTATGWPILTLAGEGEINSLVNATTSQTITFSGLSIFPGEIVTLDLRPGYKTLSSNVRGNLLSTIASGSNLSSFQLIVGANSITLTAAAESELLTESGDIITTEDGSDFLVTDTLNLTTCAMAYTKRHWSLDAVAA